MDQLKGLILDCDHVVADTNALHVNAFNSAFESAGLDCRWDASLYRRLSHTMGADGQLRAYFDRFGWPGGEANNLVLLDSLRGRHEAAFAKEVRKGHLELREDVEPLLRAAHERGVIVAVIGDWSARIIAACLHPLGLVGTALVSHVVGNDDGDPSRPNPALYHRTSALLSSAQDQLLAVSGSAAGCAAARAAGLKSAFLSRDPNGSQPEADTHISVLGFDLLPPPAPIATAA